MVWYGISREEGGRDNCPPHCESGGPNYRTRLGATTQLKEDGVRVVLSDVSLQDSGSCVLSL